MDLIFHSLASVLYSFVTPLERIIQYQCKAPVGYYRNASFPNNAESWSLYKLVHSVLLWYVLVHTFIYQYRLAQTLYIQVHTGTEFRYILLFSGLKKI